MMVHVKENHHIEYAYPLEVYMWVYYLTHQSCISYPSIILEMGDILYSYHEP